MPATAVLTWFIAGRTEMSAGSTPQRPGPSPLTRMGSPDKPPPFPQQPKIRTSGPVMPLTDLVAPNAIVPALKVNGKKQAIQELSARAARLTGQNERLIFETLMQREKLGSTGVGNGIAIPHGKLPKLERLSGLFARLDRPVDFESLDGQPVDLIFLLLAPEGAGADHLKALARVARLLREAKVVTRLRETRDADALYAVLAAPSSEAA